MTGTKQKNLDMPGQKRPKRMGRPPLPKEQKKLPALAFRPSGSTRTGLEIAAGESGRTLSQEIEHRIALSLEEDRQVGRELNALLRMYAAAANMIEARTGKSMMDDIDTYHAVRLAWQELLRHSCPGDASVTDKIHQLLEADPDKADDDRKEFEEEQQTRFHTINMLSSETTRQLFRPDNEK